MHPVEQILGSVLVSSFLEEICSFTAELSLPILHNEIDHICFRCESVTQYLEVCKNIVQFKVGTILLESMIGGRPISIISLTEPLPFKDWSISCLELTCPKPGRVHKHGYEHIEVVIGSPQDGFTNSAEFLQRFASKFPSIQFDTKAIHKEINADLSLTSPGGSSVKFHTRPIYEVCQFEIDYKHFENVPASYFE